VVRFIYFILLSTGAVSVNNADLGIWVMVELPLLFFLTATLYFVVSWYLILRLSIYNNRLIAVLFRATLTRAAKKLANMTTAQMRRGIMRSFIICTVILCYFFSLIMHPFMLMSVL